MSKRAIVGLLLVTVACSDHLSEGSGAIVSALGGDLDEDAHFPEVASVGSTCSGVLITPSHVLTAAHCVQNAASGTLSFNLTRGPGETRPLAIASCAMYNPYTIANRGCLREELVDGRDLINAARAQGDRCGVLRARAAVCPAPEENDIELDIAIVQLERPIPPPGSAEESRFVAGDLFLDPIPIANASAVFEDPITLVGYGSGQRRFVELSGVPIGPQILVPPSAGVEGGDSGGPLLVRDAAGELSVYAVAHAIRAAPGGAEGLYNGFAAQPAVLEWIAEVLDRDSDGRIDIACRQPIRRGTHSDAGPDNDQDGDGYLDGEDSCTETYNPCQVGTDFDGDGLDDDCDACPDRADIGVLRGVGVDGDGDGTLDECDCRPTQFDSPWTEDVDGDFAIHSPLVSCDNCPNVANTDQANVDGDALGDACDRCREVADVLDGLEARDTDGDDRPDACDNCPALSNGTQANCNADAEAASPDPDRPQGFGDACDPVPCGETDLGQTDELEDGGFVRIRRNDLVQVEGHALEAQEARTGFRFCRCSLASLGAWDPLDPEFPAHSDDPAVRRECLLNAGTDSQPDGDCAIDDRDGYELLVESIPWRWVTLEHDTATEQVGDGVLAEAITTYQLRDEGTFTPRLEARWGIDTDRRRWSLATGESFTEDTPGVFWTHTPGTATEPFADTIARYASHYWSGVVQPPTEARRPHPCLRHVGPWIDDDACPFCASAFPAAYLGFGGVFGGGGCEGPFSPPLLALPDLPYALGELLAFYPGPVLREDRRWVAPAEPAGWLPSTGVRLVGVDGVGPQLAPTVRLDASPFGLVPSGIDLCPNNQCQDPLLTARAAEPAPEAVLVLSARRNELWALQSGSDESAGQLRAFDLEHDLEQSGSLDLGTVHAATYRPHDDALYVLDEVRVEQHGHPRRPRREMRLLRVESGVAPSIDVVGRWPRVSPNRRFELAPAVDGGIWLVASRDRGGHLVVLLAERGARWRVDAWAHGRHPIARVQPRVDRRGLSFVVEGREGEEIVGVRLDDLHRLRHQRARDGVVRRCF